MKIIMKVGRYRGQCGVWLAIREAPKSAWKYRLFPNRHSAIASARLLVADFGAEFASAEVLPFQRAEASI